VRYLIEHETRLVFAQPVREHHCELRLAPRADDSQRLLDLQIAVEPEAELFAYTDCYDNRVHAFGIIAPHETLTTRVRSAVDTRMENPFDYPPVPLEREREWIAQALRAQPRLWDYVLHRSPSTPAAASVVPPDLTLPGYDHRRPLIDSVIAARDWIADEFAYRVGVTQVHSSLAEVFKRRAGVCQDFAHLLVSLVRAWDVPARYVTGYLDPGYVVDGAAAASEAAHAWAEVLIPGAGWRGFDATTRLITNDTYVAVAVGRDYADANPQRGSFKGEDNGELPRVALRVARDQ